MNNNLIYEAKNFSIREGTFVRSDVIEQKDIVYVDQPPVSVAIPLLDDGRIVFAEQWRPLVGSVLLECPGGKLEPNESPEDALRRELAEEIGLKPNHVRKLGDYFSSVGASTEHIYLFVASSLQPVERRAKDKEEIKLVYLTQVEARDRLRSSAFLDGKTMLALYRFFAEIRLPRNYTSGL